MSSCADREFAVELSSAYSQNWEHSELLVSHLSLGCVLSAESKQNTQFAITGVILSDQKWQQPRLFCRGRTILLSVRIGLSFCPQVPFELGGLIRRKRLILTMDTLIAKFYQGTMPI